MTVRIVANLAAERANLAAETARLAANVLAVQYAAALTDPRRA